MFSPPLSLSLFVLLSLTTPPHDRTSKRRVRRRRRRRFLPPTQVVMIKTSEAERRFPACLGNRKMDAVDKLVVRFHFNGEFLFDGKNTCYVNGREALSYVDRKKVSLNEIRDQAKEHCEVAEKALFHWCFPGKSIDDGLRVLHDDKTCLLMAKYTTQGVVADVYVELVDIEEIDTEANKDEVGSDFEDEMKEISDNDDLDDNTVELIGGNEVIMINSSPTHVNKNDMCGGKRKVFKTSSVGTKSNGDSSSDSEYLPGDSSSSGDDEEADEIEKTFKEFKRKFKAGHVSELDEITWAGGAEPSRGIVPYVLEEGHETPYYDSSDDEASFDEQGSSGELEENKLVTSRRIAEKYENLIKANPQWSLNHIQTTISEEMFANVSISKIKRAKALVMKKMFDDKKGEYSLVFNYQEELLRSNPGSTVMVKLDLDEVEPVFQRFYVCFDACKRGFLAGCRKVVGLDGCFFKGATNGELLCAIGRDANNQMYPIAWAVVEKENNDSWDWFCSLLFRDLKVGSGEGWVFISDQQKGILNAVHHWAPLVEHRNCARHIYANWKKKFRNKEWQKKFGVDNNMCESFNKWIVQARYLPIISMLEAIRCKVMVRIQENRDKAAKWNTLICPNIYKRLKSYITESAFCHPIYNGDDSFELAVPGSQQSSTSCHKRKANASARAISTEKAKRTCTGLGLQSRKSSQDTVNLDIGKRRVIRTSATARVATILGGTATMNLHAHGRSAHASSNVTITVTSGTASAHVQTHEPAPRSNSPQRKRRLPQLLLSPPRSDGNE
ncbi:Os04g0578900 [Oryza sativa Japonica Group]|uniref:OSJNBa0011J08.16 protein n=1 Tax=Oryza sativa subsp. japonica TaxID=39947 RepID=Q7XQ73_ORYSJ|nr:Os04g0578900 [Oryza sativa Japonica Group]CAE03261.1 OSJNBa0011J08.16 [Oryza sativa Japonica Group]|eukprot:NP_001174058.1 Os04g0578900 [Oryza sativa Japonica Group]